MSALSLRRRLELLGVISRLQVACRPRFLATRADESPCKVRSDAITKQRVKAKPSPKWISGVEH